MSRTPFTSFTVGNSSRHDPHLAILRQLLNPCHDLDQLGLFAVRELFT